MIFERSLFPFKEVVINDKKIFAHIDKNLEPEMLIDHLMLTVKYIEKIYQDKNLDNVFKNLATIFWDKSDYLKEIWEEMLLNAFFMHDIGKLNINFQIIKMKNKEFKKNPFIQNSKHSNFSSIIYLNYYYEKIVNLYDEGKIDDDSFTKLFFFLILNSYIISRHHSKTEDFPSEFYRNFMEGDYERLVENIKLYCPNLKYEINLENDLKGIIIENDDAKIGSDTWKEMFEKNEWDIIYVYLYIKLCYSLLVSGDFYATHEYISGKPISSLNLLTDIDEYIQYFQNTEVYKGIMEHKRTGNFFDKNDINYYRSEMFLEAESNLKLNKDKNIFFLEAPTGSGKTITSVNLALRLLKENRELNKIFYIFPFNTLVEQTYNSLTEIFAKEKIGVINSITPIKEEAKNDEDGQQQVDYESSLLNRQFIHSPVILTTHVHFFDTLFGVDRESSFALPHLANSVVIIDEVQSYRNKIWKEIIIFLNKYAELLNIKIIIMSATLPDLSVFLDDKIEIPSLIQNREKYFRNPLFKDRVTLDFSLLETEYEEEELLTLLKEKIVSEYNKTKKIVIEFIKKKKAIKFYQDFLEDYPELEKHTFLITGDDNKFERKRIIEETKNPQRKAMILIATQVIEAGVDIDMDIGFKNISILDAEEQFLGRINRSCKKRDCKAYFFKLDEAKTLYKNDKRIDKSLTLSNKEMRNILKEKNFNYFYGTVLKNLDIASKKPTDENLESFKKEQLSLLKFQNINERMKLIDNNLETKMLFLGRELLVEGKTISGKEVWKEFKELYLNNEMDYAEKKVKLSKIMEKVDLFSYNIPFTISLLTNDKIGEHILYIEDGEKYFFNGKFDSSKLGNIETDSFIL